MMNNVAVMKYFLNCLVGGCVMGVLYKALGVPLTVVSVMAGLVVLSVLSILHESTIQL